MNPSKLRLCSNENIWCFFLLSIFHNKTRFFFLLCSVHFNVTHPNKVRFSEYNYLLRSSLGNAKDSRNATENVEVFLLVQKLCLVQCFSMWKKKESNFSRLCLKSFLLQESWVGTTFPHPHGNEFPCSTRSAALYKQPIHSMIVIEMSYWNT